MLLSKTVTSEGCSCFFFLLFFLEERMFLKVCICLERAAAPIDALAQGGGKGNSSWGLDPCICLCA